MGYRTLQECVEDLERIGQLVRIDAEVDPYLEVAAIQRQVFAAGGPALYFSNVRGTRFPMVSNLFGTRERIHYLFRDSVELVQKVMRLGVDPADFMRRPGIYLNWKTPLAAWCSRPRRVRKAPVMANTCALSDLPALQCWPQDGGAYLTLPQVYTEDPEKPGLLQSNLGMYRVQISGGTYDSNQAGIHYQIHRGIGIHHARAIAQGKKLRVNVFLGGPPAMTLAAVMPLPEGMSELLFAGILGHRRVAMKTFPDHPAISAEADFCLTGYLEPDILKPEGPFGDHLGYYSLEHTFPVLRVEKVYHRTGAIFPFTVVGRPPQEDSVMGAFIHELVGDIVPQTLPGVKGVHAVDACGVHPLLLAIGQERYTPYENRRRPMEILTLANAILGTGQLSLAKYLFMVAGEDDPTLEITDVPRFFRHVLERVNWERDLHFQTRTTMDTLDYTGGALNQGSKLVVAAVGAKRRDLPCEIRGDLRLPTGFSAPKVVLPGILVVESPAWKSEDGQDKAVSRFCASFSADFPLVVLVDDVSQATATFDDFLWTTFTKSDPARDIGGIGECVRNKHWGCSGSLVIDARRKPWHAPELVEDETVQKRVLSLAAQGEPLHGIL
ncbi:MAG: UbiD family decarboxylase [Planctomycetia bacterium]|nr:UbiD family decarboxylase [Planctomycetia bacterium]